MTTAFKHALAICGLTQSEAADFLSVRLDTVKSWCSGRNQIPIGAWKDLNELYYKMQRASDAALGVLDEYSAAADQINITSSGKHGAWPSEGCALAVEAMVRLQLDFDEPENN